MLWNKWKIIEWGQEEKITSVKKLKELRSFRRLIRQSARCTANGWELWVPTIAKMVESFLFVSRKTFSNSEACCEHWDEWDDIYAVLWSWKAGQRKERRQYRNISHLNPCAYDERQAEWQDGHQNFPLPLLMAGSMPWPPLNTGTSGMTYMLFAPLMRKERQWRNPTSLSAGMSRVI